MTYATFTHLQSYEAKEKYPISLLHFKGFPFMTEHIFSPATNKQTNNGEKKRKSKSITCVALQEESKGMFNKK